MEKKWQQCARRELFNRCERSCAWSYRTGCPPSVEPTVLCALGLIASGNAESLATDRALATRVGHWLESIQRPDGSLPSSPRLPMAGWPTSYAIMLWNTIEVGKRARQHACDWLIAERGETAPREQAATGIVGHDPSLIGWPWVDGTHSWLEPTALSILALQGAGLGKHPRVDAGRALIVDRALATGGWNCGSKNVLGTEQRPQPAPTGLALLALEARGNHTPVIERGLAYLRSALTEVRAAVSVGWGVLGLRAHGALTLSAESWLEEAHARCATRPDATLGLALLLLAASERGPHLIGWPRPAGELADCS